MSTQRNGRVPVRLWLCGIRAREYRFRRFRSIFAEAQGRRMLIGWRLVLPPMTALWQATETSLPIVLQSLCHKTEDATGSICWRFSNLRWRCSSKLLRPPGRPRRGDVSFKRLARCASRAQAFALCRARAHGAGSGAPDASRALIADERAFIDANTMAVRQSDLPTQLFCLAAEGWQALTLGQVMNAQFRGQQVEKLADKSNIFLRGWAHLLVQSAQLRDASMITVREQADLLDLATQAKDPAWAWSTALHLSAARFDAELSAWFSMHRSVLLDSSFATRACLAMSVLGDRSDSARRLVPLRHPSQYRGAIDEAKEVESYETMLYLGTPDVGQVTINLFGGFHVLRQRPYPDR